MGRRVWTLYEEEIVGLADAFYGRKVVTLLGAWKTTKKKVFCIEGGEGPEK